MKNGKLEHSLLKVLGLWAVTASIFNCTVGGGIFRLPSAVYAMVGTSAPWLYLICAVMIFLISLNFAEAGSRVALTGGPYAYVASAFSPFMAFQGGVLAWLTGTLSVASVASALAGNLGVLSPVLANPGARAGALCAVFLILALVNVRGVRHGIRLVEVLSVFKLLPLLVFIFAGVFWITPKNFVGASLGHPGYSPGHSIAEMARAAIVLLFAFTGPETGLVPSGEVRDPARNVPRALFIAMVGVALLYFSIHMVAQGILGPDLGKFKDAPLAEAAARAWGSGGRILFLVAASVSMLGYLSGTTLSTPRSLFAFARDGYLPRGVGWVHPRFHTPAVAIVIQTALACALAISNSFEELAVVSNVAALLLYLACAAAAWKLRRSDVRISASSPVFKTPGGPLLLIATSAVIFWLLTSITRGEWLLVLGVMAVASVLFASTMRRRSSS